MITYDSIAQKILNSNKKISNEDVYLISKYFISLLELNIINDESLINDLVNKVVNELEGIVYYDNNDVETLNKLEIGTNNKGLSKNNIIYVNKNMTNEMVKITLFHELTHFLQRFYVDGLEECIGVMQNWKWRILMEAQTQNLAEMIYTHNYGGQTETKEINSEEMRMLPGGTIRSNLRNYEMYDSILRKILLVLDMSIEEFISLNFNKEKSLGMFEKRINDKYGNEVTNFIWEILDVIYSTDAIIYKEGITSLKDPCNVSSLVDGREINVSSKNQFRFMKQLDRLLLYLSKNDINKFSELLDLQFFAKEEYLPQSNIFSEVSHTSLEEVEANPERYIMSECIPACKELWSKNIYTFMVSNYEGESGIWIEIYNEISNENLEYLKRIKSKNIAVNIYHNGCYQIMINHIGQNASDLLLEICKGFKMQDVPKNIAYYNEEDFLITCGCYDEISNPNYYEMKEFYEMEFDSLEEQKNYIKKYDEWEHSDDSKQTIKKFNPYKKIKSVEEYATERNMIYKDGRVYLSKFDYNKHIKYEHFIETQKEEQLYSSHYENGVETLKNNYNMK